MRLSQPRRTSRSIIKAKPTVASNHYKGGAPFVTVSVSLGDNSIRDHEQHLSSGESNPPGKNWLRDSDQGNIEQPADRLYQTSKSGIEEGADAGVALPGKRKDNSKAFGHVLKADPDGKGDCSAAEPNPHGKAFGEVMDGDRQDKQPDLA